MNTNHMRFHISFDIDWLLGMSDNDIVQAVQLRDPDITTAQAIRDELMKLQSEGMKAIPQSHCNEADERGYCKGFETT